MGEWVHNLRPRFYDLSLQSTVVLTLCAPLYDLSSSPGNKLVNLGRTDGEVRSTDLSDRRKRQLRTDATGATGAMRGRIAPRAVDTRLTGFADRTSVNMTAGRLEGHPGCRMENYPSPRSPIYFGGDSHM
jgi:hypothetical protein